MNWRYTVTRTALAGALGACRPSGQSADAALLLRARGVFAAIATPTDSSDARALAQRQLGRRLFFEPRLSVDGRVSCATCHLPAHYASDSLPLSVGVLNRRTPRNVPTVLNASLNFVEHWRGDRASLEDQALKALTGPQSAGNPNVAVAQRRLRSLREYGPLFAAAFAEDSPIVSATHFAAAVAAYQRTLLTPSRFDRYLGGDSTVLLATERRGLRLFIDVGCVGCHNGPGVGGNSFRKFGVYQDYWQATGSRSIDLGRFDVTHDTTAATSSRCRACATWARRLPISTTDQSLRSPTRFA